MQLEGNLVDQVMSTAAKIKFMGFNSDTIEPTLKMVCKGIVSGRAQIAVDLLPWISTIAAYESKEQFLRHFSLQNFQKAAKSLALEYPMNSAIPEYLVEELESLQTYYENKAESIEKNLDSDFSDLVNGLLSKHKDLLLKCRESEKEQHMNNATLDVLDNAQALGPGLIWQLERIAGMFGEFKCNFKSDIRRIQAKLQQALNDGKEFNIYDSVRCAVEVTGIEGLKRATDEVLKHCKGRVLKVKPKLNTPLMNITIHTGVHMEYNRMQTIPMAGEIQIQLKHPDT